VQPTARINHAVLNKHSRLHAKTNKTDARQISMHHYRNQYTSHPPPSVVSTRCLQGNDPSAPPRHLVPISLPAPLWLHGVELPRQPDRRVKPARWREPWDDNELLRDSQREDKAWCWWWNDRDLSTSSDVAD